MNIITNWRYHVLMAVATVAIVGIVSEVQADGMAWVLGMITTKGIGGITAYAFYRMIKKWLADGSIPELEDMAKEE